MLSKSWKKISPRVKLNRYFKEKIDFNSTYIYVNLNPSRKSGFVLVIIYMENYVQWKFSTFIYLRIIIYQIKAKRHLRMLSNLYKIFYAHLPWFLIFLTFTDIPYVQYFLPVVKKILCVSKKEKKLDLTFEISIRIFVRFEKFAEWEKRIEWKINKKSRETIENWFSKKKKKKRTWPNHNDKRVCTHCKLYYSSPLNRN